MPLCLAANATGSFVWLTYQMAEGNRPADPWHPFSLAPYTFYLSMAWSAVVIVAWSVFLTKSR